VNYTELPAMYEMWICSLSVLLRKGRVLVFHYVTMSVNDMPMNLDLFRFSVSLG
jgi:hypothetical protein